MNPDELMATIERWRKVLNHLVEKKQGLHDPEIGKVNARLDALITAYYRSSKML